MMKRASVVILISLAACSPKPGVTPGSTSFVTDVQPIYGFAGGAAETNSAPSATTTPAAPPQGRTGTVEEADIYQVDQNRLFYLDTYRGFLVYDLTDTKNPQLVSRLPVYGYPIEMYVDGNTVYALLRDALYLTQNAGKPSFQRRDTSQLVTIDVTNPAQPKVLKTTDIIGELREGVSRKIDDTIYVVSYISSGYYFFYDGDDEDQWWSWYGDIDPTQDQAWVYSFNVANAQSPQLVDKLQVFAGGDTSSSSSTSGKSRTFEDVQISATSNTLHVAQNWQTYGWSVANDPFVSCDNEYGSQQAVVSIIDISDPSGAIHLYSTFSTYGRLTDQFKQTYVYNPTTQHAYYYGIFSLQAWAYDDCSGGDFTRNAFETWDVTDGANPKLVGSVNFGDNETVGASTFDTTNMVAYAVTSQQTDPVFAIGFSNPTSPTILSAVNGLAGSMSVFRFMDTAQHFLLGIGADSSASCTGNLTGEDEWEHSGVSVSIFDVSNPSAVKLVQRHCVDVADAAWISSNVNFDLDQGHKMIGDTSIGGVNIVAVPVNFVSQQQQQSWWWYQYSSAVGLMTWDLSTYDPTKTTVQNVLTVHGSVAHKNGSVRRTIPFVHTDGSGARNMLLNLSDTYLSLYDISNVDAPVLQAETEVAPDIEELFHYGGYVVEHVRDEGFDWGFDTASEFRVKAAPPGTVVDTAPTIATFTVGQVESVVQWKSSLVIFRHKSDPSQPQWTYGQDSQVVVYDLTDPTHPKLSSITDVGMPLYPNYVYWCGGFALPWFGWWWNSAINNWVSFDGGIAFVARTYDQTSQKSSDVLVHIDLSNIGAPRVLVHDVTHDTRDNLALVVDSTDTRALYLAYRDLIGKLPNDGTLSHYHYYAQRWSLDGSGDLVPGDATNVPGQLLRTWKSGDRTLLVTQDQRLTLEPTTKNDYTSDPRLFLLEQADSSTATLLDSHVFGGRSLSSLVADGDSFYLTTSGYTDVNGTFTQDDDHLVIIDAGSLTLAPQLDSGLGLTNTQAMGVGNHRLFVNLSGGGVLTLDVTNPQAPVGKSFLRTLGWGSSLDVDGDTLYVAGGNFGVFQRDISTTALTQ